MATYRKTRSGNWEVRVAKKGHAPLYKTFRTKAMGQEWARKKEDEIAQGLISGFDKKLMVADVLKKYQKEITPRKASSNREESRIKLLSRELGKLYLIDLSPEKVIGYVDTRRKAGILSDTIRKELGTLSHVIKTCRALWGIKLPENPVAVAKEILSVTRTLRPGNQRIRRLKPGEFKRLMKASPQRKVIRFALETAMRRGEIANIKPEHRDKGLLHIPETKTDKARIIPLTKKAQRILDEGPFDLTADAITKAFNRACKNAGIKDLRFHDLRHEAISRLFEKGLEVHEVAAISGHSDWKTLKRYTHVLPEDIAKKLS